MDCTPVDSKEMKREDLLQFLNVFSSEFNNSSLHDRVLVFQVGQVDSQDETLGVLHKKGEGRNKEKVKDEVVKRKQDEEEKVPVKGENYDNYDDDDDDEVDEREEEEKKETEKDDEEKREVVDGKTEIDESEDELLWNNGKNIDEDAVTYEETGSDGHRNKHNKHKIFVHSCWLAVQSSHFRALFYSGMKESHSKEVVMKIDESELQSHLTLIEAMYKLDILNDKDYSLVLEVFVLADRYDVNLVFKKCKYILVDTQLTLEKCEQILECVKDLPDCDDLLDLLTRFLVKEFSPLDKTWTMRKFIDLSEASLRLTLSSNDLAVQSENTVFVALMKWIDSNVTTSHQQSFQEPSLISLVRFEFMSVDFLYDVVRKRTTATKMAGFSELLQKGLGYHGFSQERLNELKDKPIQRSSFTDEGPTFSWVIDRDVRSKLSPSGQQVSSSHFWCQGYEMVVELSYEAESNSFGVYLIVLDVEDEGCLNLSWTAKSDLFMGHSFTMCEMYSNGSYWGHPELKCSKLSLASVPEHSSHTIDLWVKFN